MAGYGRQRISSVPDFDLEPGSTALLVGSSGAGKTTLLLAIAGLADLVEGDVSLEGRNLNHLSRRDRDRHRGRTIGFIFQDLYLVSGLTVVQNLLLAPFAAATVQDPARARALIDELGLGLLADQPAERLSRGEAQRAAVARAMLMRPRLVIADEPTASLDDDACAATLALLQRAAAESDAALLIASHDARVKAAIARQLQVVSAR